MEPVTPRLLRVTLGGSDLAGLTVADPAASVRLLIPPAPDETLVVPNWNGNEFLLPDGRRPTIRTFTPWRVDAAGPTLDIGVVLHGDGAASRWARAAAPGSVAAVSGPGRGYAIDEHATAFVVAGDETAIPAITQLLERLPRAATFRVWIEVARPTPRMELPDHPAASIEWLDLPRGVASGDAILAAIVAARVAPTERVWVAGEAAAVQRIRRSLFQDRQFPRAQATIRGYWKHGRAGQSADD